MSKSEMVIKGTTYKRASVVAEELGYSEWYLVKLGNTNQVPSIKLGRIRWFNTEQVMAAILDKAGINGNGSDKFNALAGI